MYQQIGSASTDPTNEDDSTSKHIFEYYRKYSQNRELNKYFSGTPLSYLPEIKDDEDDLIECVPDLVIQTDADIVLVTNSSAAKDEQSVSSTTSSVNHKLEWDSLADIGYNASNHLTSHLMKKNNTSIPGIKGVDIDVQISNDSPSYSPSVDLDNISDNAKLIIFPYSSSSEELEDIKNYSISQASSSISEEKKTTVSSVCSIPIVSDLQITDPCTSSSDELVTSRKISNFKNTLSYLKKKIGVPEAHSTPNFVDKKNKNLVTGNSETSAAVIKIVKAIEHNTSSEGNSKRNSDISESKLIDSDNKKTNLENIKKSMTQGSEEVQTVLKRVVNLCQTKPIAVECLSTTKLEDKMMQTENEDNHVAVQTLPSSYSELRKITNHVQHNSNHHIIFETHLETDENNEKITKASSELLSDENTTNNSGKSRGKSCSETDDNVNNKNSDNKTETVETECCQTSSENVQKAEDIPSSSSDNPSEYIEKYINLLQRLLKSKKYDSGTKKHYLKRIIKKISESKFLEESSATQSASSDLFFPKKSNSNLQTFLEAKVLPDFSPNSTDSIDDQSSKNNISRHISNDSKSKLSPRKRASQIHPIQAIEDFSSNSKATEVDDNVKENIPTTADNQFYIKNQSPKQQSYAESIKSVDQQYDTTSTSKSYNNWKENKTISERILEEIDSPSCNGGYLIEFKNKKNYRIDCIDTEINKLAKSKCLLKKSVELSTTKKNLAIQPKITTTYTVSEKGNNDIPKRRNFVIETNLDAGTSRDKCFRLDGKNFVVENLRDNEKTTRTRQVLADLEIISSDTTTNIKVTTFCEACKHSPCTCQSKSSEKNYPQRIDYAEKKLGTNVCHKCSSLCCSCSSSGSGSSHSICSFCCTSPCSCYCKMGCRKTQTENNKKCSACNDSSCHCTGNEKKEKSEIFAHATERCSKCRGSSPIHALTRKSSCTNSHGTSTASSTETANGSINKLFLNCKCDLETRCNCGFVDKLLRHFRQQDLVNRKNFETKISQTENPKDDPNSNSIRVQVNAETVNEISQTVPKVQSDSRNVGIQTRIPSMENKESETSSANLVEPMRTSQQTEQETTTEAQGKTASKNSMDDYQRNAVTQTSEQILETNSSVDSEFQGSDKTKTDDVALMNRGRVTQKMDTSKSTDTSTSSSSYICVSRYTKNSSSNGRADLKHPNAVHSARAQSSASISEKPHSNTVSPNPLSPVTCICCKKTTSIENISILQSSNQEYPLCHHCLGKKPILTSVCYTGPEEPVIQKSNANSDSFRRIGEYCTCVKQSRVQNSFYCCHCQFKLKKTVKSRNAIAYTLTLENETPRKLRSHKKQSQQLEEIKVKVPCISNGKTSKNKENFSKKGAKEVPIRKSSENTNSETEKRDVEKPAGPEKKSSKGNPTLQEYLMANRPDFLDSAEYRRLTVVNHRTERQLNRDEIKLRFIENDLLKPGEIRGTSRLFTEREMREITSKNYKKLPEVQQKLIQSRERRLRDADKFIVDIFKKNVQGSVLKGKRTFPLNTNIVDMRA